MAHESLTQPDNPSAPHPRKSAAKSSRGGRRPGAGAPRGNLNGLKHGLRSRQMAQLGLLFATEPKTREALLALAQRHQLKQQKAKEVAALLLTKVIQRGLRVGDDPKSQAFARNLGEMLDRMR